MAVSLVLYQIQVLYCVLGEAGGDAAEYNKQRIRLQEERKPLEDSFTCLK